MLAFTLSLAVITGFVFGLAPLLHLGSRLALTLRDGARTTGGGARRALRGSLVIAEVALAVTLVVGAGLLVRSFVNLMRVDAGFNRSHLITFGVVPPVLGNPQTPAERQARRQRFADFFEQMRARLAALPGVQNATAMSGLPPNRPVLANDTDFEWIPNLTGPNAFAANSQYPIQNVDYWPGFGDDLAWFTVVGVLKDVKQGGVDAPAGTELYLLEDQLPKYTFVTTNMNFVVRTTVPFDTLAGPMRQVVHDLDPALPIVKLETMDDVFGESVARPKFLTMLLGIFAGLALALAAVGTYGILSYLVTERSREIGIRMALGADRSNILGHFLWRGVSLAGVGLLAGLGASLVLTKLMRTLLFGVTPTDPATLALVCGVMAVVASVACLVSAWRATRVDPLVVLRDG